MEEKQLDLLVATSHKLQNLRSVCLHLLSDVARLLFSEKPPGTLESENSQWPTALHGVTDRVQFFQGVYRPCARHLKESRAVGIGGVFQQHGALSIKADIKDVLQVMKERLAHGIGLIVIRQVETKTLL